MEDLGMGEAQGAKAGADVRLVAADVIRLLGRGPVMAEAVGLDDEAEVRPEEVDAMTAEARLGVWRRQPSGADQSEEAPLEGVLGAAESLRVEDRLQSSQARPPRLAFEGCAQTMGADQVEAIGCPSIIRAHRR